MMFSANSDAPVSVCCSSSATGTVVQGSWGFLCKEMKSSRKKTLKQTQCCAPNPREDSLLILNADYFGQKTLVNSQHAMVSEPSSTFLHCLLTVLRAAMDNVRKVEKKILSLLSFFCMAYIPPFFWTYMHSWCSCSSGASLSFRTFTAGVNIYPGVMVPHQQ